MSETPVDPTDREAVTALYEARELKRVVTAVELLAMPAEDFSLGNGSASPNMAGTSRQTQYPTTQNNIIIDYNPDNQPD